MTSERVQETLDTLNNLKPHTSISLTIDLANEDPNSICCIALAWISGANVRGIYYYVKPPKDDFSSSRKITAEMVANCDSFADVWDRDIFPLLKSPTLSAYRSEALFGAIKASYEESGRPFKDENFFVRDLLFLAKTYLPNLGNDSLLSITHKMNIDVDLDSPLSRAMACVCADDWLNSAYPAEDYGIPMAIILGTAEPETLLPRKKGLHIEPLPNQNGRNPYIFRNPFIGLGVFLLVSVISIGYYMFMQSEMINNANNFPTTSTEQKAQIPTYDKDKTYYMGSGTYIILREQDLANAANVLLSKNTDAIRSMVQEGKIIVFADRTAIKVTGTPLDSGFVPVTVAAGSSVQASGFAPYTMIEN